MIRTVMNMPIVFFKVAQHNSAFKRDNKKRGYAVLIDAGLEFPIRYPLSTVSAAYSKASIAISSLLTKCL